MVTIVSKRHPIKFYFSLIAVTLFTVGLGVAIFYFYYKSADSGQLKPKEEFMPFFSLVFFVLAGYSLYRYLKNAPLITINNNSISFNKQTFSITEIKDIQLTGKQAFNYILSFPMEAAKLTFVNGETKYIFDDFYSNSWQMKLFLKQVVVLKKDFLTIESPTIDYTVVDNDFYETFYGNQLTTLRGISLWGIICLLGYFLLNNQKPNSILLIVFVGVFSIFWFIVNSYLMHYFKVSDNFLVVKNHNFFWKKKAFNISDIKEVVFETQGRSPNCLRVITKDFKNKHYPAATLSDKTWLALKDKLETYYIEVRNECI